MEGAHHNSYVSKNFMANYAKKKQKIAQKKAGGAMGLSIVKEEKVKEEEKKSAGSDSEAEDDFRNRSVSSVCAADLDNDLNYSDEESQEVVTRTKAARVGQKRKFDKKEVYHHEVDTNVYKINFGCLKNDKVELATGDPIFCTGC